MELSPIEREELSKNRIPIVLLFEPSADEFSYESKFVPLTDKYLDPAFFTPYIVGTSGLTRSLSGTGSIPLELRIAFTGHRGIIRFFLYVTALAMSSFLLVRATKISRSKVLATMAGHCYTGFVVAVVGKITRKKTVIRISEPTRLLLKRNHRPGLIYIITCWTEKVALSLADAVYSVRDMSDYCYVAPNKNWIIAQGVDISSIESSRPLELDQHFSPTIVTVSRLDSEKGIFRLIDSIALLRDRFPNVGCVVIGWGPDLESLRGQVSRLGINERVSFKGYLRPVDIPSAIKACDIFVLPSELEGVPSSVLEAMACGLPVITCLTSGAFAASLSQAQATINVTASPIAIADAIEKLWNDRAFTMELAKRGIAYVKENYDKSKSRGDFLKLITKLDPNANGAIDMARHPTQ